MPYFGTGGNTSRYPTLSRYPARPGGGNPFAGNEIIGEAFTPRTRTGSYGDLVFGAAWEQDRRQKAADEARRQEITARFGNPPPGTDPEQWYRQKETESGYTSFSVPKNQRLMDFTKGLESRLGDATSGLDFASVLNAAKGLEGLRPGVNNRYGEYGASLDPTAYLDTLRRAEDRARLGNYEAEARGLTSGMYGSVADYERRGLGALDTGLANAYGYVDEDLPANLAQVNANVGKLASKYSIGQQGQGGSGGLSSGLAGLVASETSKQSLPYRWAARGAVQQELNRYEPFYSNVASRQRGAIEFNYGAISDLANRYNTLTANDRATAERIYNTMTEAKLRELNNALNQFGWNAQAVAQIAEAMSLPASVIMKHAQTAAYLGGMSDLYQYSGVRGPDEFLQSPTGSSNSLRDYPNRYAPGNTETGNTGGGQPPGNRYTANPLPGGGIIPGWMQGLTPAQRAAYDQNMLGQRYAPVTTNPQGTYPGGGRINDRYLGTDSWRNNPSIQAMTAMGLFPPGE